MIRAQDVDLVVVNGNIYTVNEKQPHAEAFAVRDQRIAFVGSTADVQKLRSANTRVIELAVSFLTVAAVFQIFDGSQVCWLIFWCGAGL